MKIIAILTWMLAVSGSLAADTLAEQMSQARSVSGDYIAWREHIIDDEATGGVPIRGADGLQRADLDGDGRPDIVSVHESDEVYDGVADGYIRIAFATDDPDQWEWLTLAEGREAGAAEDVAIGDVNGDGYPDIVAACELAHLIYFQNPGADSRRQRWPRVIPPVASGRGSFIRVFLADLNADGRVEVITANKGAQDPNRTSLPPKPISFFDIKGQPLEGDVWVEHELTRVPWPINARPVDLDGDGDTDIIGGSVAEGRIFWFENRSRAGRFDFREHVIRIRSAGDTEDGAGNPPVVNGFNMDFADLNHDGRLDIVTFQATRRLLGDQLVWLEQPRDTATAWRLHRIGGYAPDVVVGLRLADINGDGDLDLMTGGYSLGPRDTDDGVTINDALGRLAWFENPGNPDGDWLRHDLSRRKRGMFDQFVAADMDGDGDLDFAATRGNSGRYDGVVWLEQLRSPVPLPAFTPAREQDSPELPLPAVP